MTVLDFDPPQPTLRLVSSNGETASRDHRYRDGAQLRGDARDLYLRVMQAALERGAAIDSDALRVVLAAKQATSASPARAFSAAAIWQLMFVDVVSWCRNRQLDVPAGCTRALTFTVQYLDDTESFDELSDPIHLLYEAIDECTGGWADEPHPASPPTTTTSPSNKAQRSLRSDRGPKRT